MSVNGIWTLVATPAGNLSVNTIRQTADELRTDIQNASGAHTTLDQRITNNEASLTSLTSYIGKSCEYVQGSWSPTNKVTTTVYFVTDSNLYYYWDNDLADWRTSETAYGAGLPASTAYSKQLADANTAKIENLTSRMGRDYIKIDTWNGDTTPPTYVIDGVTTAIDNQGNVYYDGSLYYYYEDSTWKSTNEPWIAGLVSSIAVMRQQVDQDAAWIDMVAENDNTNSNTLAYLRLKTDNYESRLQSLESYTEQNYITIPIWEAVIITSWPIEDPDISKVYFDGTTYYYSNNGEWSDTTNAITAGITSEKDFTKIYYASDTQLYYYGFDSNSDDIKDAWRSSANATDAGLIEAIASVEQKASANEGAITLLTGWTGDLETATTTLSQSTGDQGAMIKGIVSQIDKYHIGTVSQACGLTQKQAVEALIANTIYIPTVTHTETYECIRMSPWNSSSPDLVTNYIYFDDSVTPTKYYYKRDGVWTSTTSNISQFAFTQKYVYRWINGLWSSQGLQAIFSDTYVSTQYLAYWYVNSDNNVTYEGKTYYARTLYLWSNNQWNPVSFLHESEGRALSQVAQTANEVKITVANANQAMAALDMVVDGQAAQITQIASVVKPKDITVTSTVDTIEDLPNTGVATNAYYAVGTSAPYSIYQYDGTTWNKQVRWSSDGVNVTEVNAASIVSAVNDDSSVYISADKIVMTGETTFLKPSDLSGTYTSGSTTIDGSRITTGILQSANYPGVQRTITLRCISYGESTYDFGIISKVNRELSLSNSEDSEDEYEYNFKGDSKSAYVDRTIDLPQGESFITIKYIKDSSASSNDDSFKFKILEDINWQLSMPDAVTYGFTLTSDGYYTSTNQGYDNTYSYAKCTFYNYAGMSINLNNGTLDTAQLKMDAHGNLSLNHLYMKKLYGQDNTSAYAEIGQGYFNVTSYLGSNQSQTMNLLKVEKQNLLSSISENGQIYNQESVLTIGNSEILRVYDLQLRPIVRMPSIMWHESYVGMRNGVSIGFYNSFNQPCGAIYGGKLFGDNLGYTSSTDVTIDADQNIYLKATTSGQQIGNITLDARDGIIRFLLTDASQFIITYLQDDGDSIDLTFDPYTQTFN